MNNFGDYYHHGDLSLQEAVNFLVTYQAQVATTLIELKSMDQKLKNDVCCFKELTQQQLKKLNDDEQYANQMFQKLRSRLFDFMEENRGIKF